MSYIKIAEELFLGTIELQRFQQFMQEEGFIKYIRKISTEFGLIDSLKDIFDNGLVEKSSISGAIKIKSIFAIDSDGLFLSREPLDNIELINDNQWYWLKISHNYNTFEGGFVNIDQYGNLTGIDTEFIKIFRGQPDFPTKIKFINPIYPNILNNNLEYEILEIIDNTNAKLQGSFVAETNLQFSIVGTFTEGHIPPTQNKYPFQYDTVKGELILGNTIPSYTPGKEFFLARVKRNGTNIYIEDKRSAFRLKLESDYFLNELPLKQNPLIGIEELKFDSSLSTKEKNIVYISWCFRANNYTFDPTTNLLTITYGKGGIFKDTNFSSIFNDGDFNGWRIYTSIKGNIYLRILNSIKDGSTLKLTLMNGDVDILSSSYELIIAPPAEEIEIICTASANSPDYNIEIVNSTFLFPINKGIGKMPLMVNSDGFLYNIRYKYKSHGNYSEIYNLISDSVGYLSENQHDSDGNVLDPLPIPIPYTVTSFPQGFIPLKLSNTAYSIYNLGDLPGFRKIAILTSTSQIDLEVGIDVQNQIIYAGSVVTLTGNLIINLKSTVNTKNGNRFNLSFLGNIDLDGNTIQIRENYINPGSPGTLLQSISQNELDYRQNSGLDIIWIEYMYSGSVWTNLGEDNIKRVYSNFLNIVDINSAWLDYIYSLAELSTDGGSTVASIFSQLCKYKVLGKTLFLDFNLVLTFTGTPTFLGLTLPGGLTYDLTHVIGLSYLYSDNSTGAGKELGLATSYTTTKKALHKANLGSFDITNKVYFMGQFIIPIL